MEKLIPALIIGIAALSRAASASSPQAWQQLDRRVARACIASAGLAQAKVMADKASFSVDWPAGPLDHRVGLERISTAAINADLTTVGKSARLRFKVDYTGGAIAILRGKSACQQVNGTGNSLVKCVPEG